MCAEDLASRNQLEQNLDLKGALRSPWNQKQAVGFWLPGVVPHLCLIYQKQILWLLSTNVREEDLQHLLYWPYC